MEIPVIGHNAVEITVLCCLCAFGGSTEIEMGILISSFPIPVLGSGYSCSSVERNKALEKLFEKLFIFVSFLKMGHGWPVVRVAQEGVGVKWDVKPLIPLGFLA